MKHQPESQLQEWLQVAVAFPFSFSWHQVGQQSPVQNFLADEEEPLQHAWHSGWAWTPLQRLLLAHWHWQPHHLQAHLLFWLQLKCQKREFPQQ